MHDNEAMTQLMNEAVTIARQNRGSSMPGVYVPGSDAKMTPERVFAQALEANPEAYDSYRRQHNAGALVRTLQDAGFEVVRR